MVQGVVVLMYGCEELVDLPRQLNETFDNLIVYRPAQLLYICPGGDDQQDPTQKQDLEFDFFLNR